MIDKLKAFFNLRLKMIKQNCFEAKTNMIKSAYWKGRKDELQATKQFMMLEDKCSTVKAEIAEEEAKPPLGLRPREIALMDRLLEIQEAMTRYTQKQKFIPIPWMTEYLEIMTKLGGECHERKG